jgi:hypothetical protein
MDAIAKAKQRALAQGVRVWSLESGKRYCVPSCTNDGVGYEVGVHEGEDLSCNCPAGQHGRPCKHVAGVLARLESEQPAPQPKPERSLSSKLRDLYPHMEG